MKFETIDQIYLIEQKGSGVQVWSCYAYEDRIQIPEKLQDLPVLELAPYCFSDHQEEKALQERVQCGQLQLCCFTMGRPAALPQERDLQELLSVIPRCAGNRVKEIRIPSQVIRVGRYCFYNCANLQVLSFYGRLKDWGSGVFTGCHHIHQLNLTVDSTGASMLKEVLEEVPERVRVSYRIAENEEKEPAAILVFPEFFEEGIENTPARILETRIHGSGMVYRNCFRGRCFDFESYDRQFLHAISQESSEVTASLAENRLRFPYQLSDRARENYQTYLRQNRSILAGHYVKEKNLEGLQWFFTILNAAEQKEIADQLLEQASREEFPSAVSFLMPYTRKKQESTEEGAGLRIRRKRLQL